MYFKFFKKNILTFILLLILIGCLIHYYRINNTLIEGKDFSHQCLPCGRELNFQILNLLGVACKGINC